MKSICSTLFVQNNVSDIGLNALRFVAYSLRGKILENFGDIPLKFGLQVNFDLLKWALSGVLRVGWNLVSRRKISCPKSSEVAFQHGGVCFFKTGSFVSVTYKVNTWLQWVKPVDTLVALLTCGSQQRDNEYERQHCGDTCLAVHNKSVAHVQQRLDWRLYNQRSRSTL